MTVPSCQRRLLPLLLSLGLLAGCGDNTPSPSLQSEPPATQTATLLPPWPPLDKVSTNAAASSVANYYVVLDASGSMSKGQCADGSSKLAVAKKAVVEFANALREDTHFGLLAFDGHGVRERIPLGPVRTRNLGQILNPIRADGGTPLRTAITAAYDALKRQGQAQLGYGEYHLVVVTDGEFAPENQDPSQIVGEILGKSPVVFHTVGFCIDSNHSLNQPGRILYSAANSPQELVRGLQSVLAEAPDFAVSRFE